MGWTTWSRARLGVLVGFLGLLLGMGGGCSYSFQTVSLPNDINTLTVRQFQNNSSLVVPTLAQELSQAVRDQFTSQSRLNLRDKDGDILLSGAIQRYEVAPVNIGSAGSAAQNRLTMSVRVVYENRVRPAEGWEESFSTFVDFPQSESLASVQNQLNQELNQQLATDIFNRAFGNW